MPALHEGRAVRRAFKHRANHWYNESDSTEDDERTASAFRIGHRAGTAVLPPCSTPQQLTEHQNKNTRRGTAGAFILVDHFPPQSNTFLLLHSSKKFICIPVFYACDRDISRGLLAEGIEPNQEVIIVQIYPHQERFKQACQVLAVIDVTIPVDVQQ